MNHHKKELVSFFFLLIFITNIFIILTPVQREDFFDSKGFMVELLKGFGFIGERKETYHDVPRLLGTNSHSNNNDPFRIRSATQSEYYVPGWADSRWKNRKNITIDSSKVSADLTDFPVLINIFDCDLQSDAQANGNDIMFTDASGNILDHEIELYNRVYNSTHTHLVAWVKTNLSSTQDTIISMYFGNPTISNQENVKEVWGDNYVGVWHLTESGTGTVDEFKDSSQYNNHGQGGEGNSSFIPTKVGGKIGYGQDFNDLDGYYDLIDCGNDSSFNITGYSITMEAWIQHNITPQEQFYGIMNHKGWYNGYSLWIEQNSLKLAFNLPGETHKLLSATDITTNSWHHIVATYDGTLMRIYIDGVQDPNTLAKSNSIAPSSAEQDFWIGHGDQPKDKGWSAEWDGQIDEVRISNITHDSDWIITEYENQNDPQSFYYVGTKQNYENYDWAFPMLNYRKKIIINADKVSSDLTDFALLIDLYDINLHDTDKVQADGDDILFTDVSGTKLNHEIELFDQTGNGTHANLLAWVEIPNLSKTKDTSIFMYYGNDEVSSLENPSAVWNNNYIGVWHLSETNGPVYDSTSYGYDGLVTGASYTSLSFIDGGYEFIRSETDLIEMPETANAFQLTDFTVEAWIKTPDSTVPDDYYIVTQSLYSATTSWALNIADDSGHENEARFTTRVSSQQIVYSNFPVTGNEWHHLVGVRNSTSLLIYVDGSLAGSETDNEASQTLQSPVNVSIGSAINTSSEDFNGIIDEVRISNIARSAAWLETQYNNQFDPNGFYSIEMEEYSPIEDDWAFPQFNYRKPITIKSDQVNADLTNFPVLLNITDPDLHDNGKVQVDGADILFADNLGTKLDHEIELFDQTGNGTHAHLVAWVRVPNLLSTYNTNITMYYGNDVVDSQEYHQGVWDSNYVGVWHMNQNPPLIEDSTSPNSDGTTYGSMTSADQITGQIGGSLDFDATDDYVDCGDPTELQITGAMTIEAWVYADFVGNDYLVGRNGPTNERGWDLSFDDDPGIEPDGWIMFRLATGANSHRSIGYERINVSQWYHVVGVYNPSSYLRFYLNGQLVAEDTTSIPSTQYVGSNPFRFGTRADNPCYYNGTLDEIRISNVVRSLDWIETEYKNQFDPDNFYSVGLEQIHESDRWAFPMFKYRKTITIDSNKVNGSGSLVNFPVLLNITDSDLHDNGKVQVDGDDILFADNLGTKLDHEIELFDQIGNGTHAYFIGWVRVPSLSSTKNTNITMYYGNNAVNRQENPEGVWDTNFMLVHHFDETIGTTSYDSTSNNEDGTIQGATTLEVTGKIGNSYQFDDSPENQRVRLTSLGALTAFTMEMWVYPHTGEKEAMWGRNFQIDTMTEGTGITYATYGSKVFGAIIPDGPEGVGSARVTLNAESETSENTWNHLVVTYNGSTLRMYVNGDEVTDSPKTGMSSPNYLFSSNHYFAYTGYNWETEEMWFDGKLDEARLSNLVRSVNWIATEYNNQYDPNSFYSIGLEETCSYWWADSSFNKRKDIAILNEKVSGDLLDFPVLIDIYDSDLHTDVQGNGADILFFDMWGTKLDHEIEYFNQSFNSTHAHLIAWVRVPTLYNNNDTLISMYYGNNKLPSQENPSGVWKEDYKGVWHLPEDPSGPTPQMIDSTSNNNHGTTTNLDTDDQVNGQIDGSIDFDNTQDHINCGNQTSLNMGSGDLSLSLWFNYDGVNWGPIAGKGAILGGIRYYICFSTPAGQITAEIDDDGASGKKSVSSTSTYGDNLWHHIVLVRDGNYLRLYIDGIEDPNSPIDITDYGNLDNVHPFYMNTLPSDNSGTLSSWSTVKLDEVRASNTAYSGNWIVTEYNNQFNSTSFYTIGSEVVLDETPPEILNFGVDDPGTGLGKFWAEITDDSEINSVEVTINNTKYTMSWNGTYWTYDFSVGIYQGYYEYLITNASDIVGNYRSINSNLKSCKFDKDLMDPNVLDWEYYDTLGPYGTFKANITDSWGEIDIVRLNVTTHNMQALMGRYATFGSTVFAYLNDTLEMPNGLMDFQIIVNDTAGNEFISTTHQGDVFSNHPPIVENLTLSPTLPWSNCSLTLTYDYHDEDGHGEAGTEIRWYKKNDSVFLLEPTYNDTKVIPTSALEVGDQWYVNVTPKDGGVFGETNMSAIITILNTPPSVSNVVVFYSGSDPYTTSTLNIDYTYDDHEGDTEDTNNREVEWYRNGTQYPALDNSTSVSPENTTKGETWYYRIRVHDGTDYSGWVTSDTVLIHNSLPQAVNLTLPSNPTTMDDLVAAWDMADADGDTEDLTAVIIYWYKDGENQSAWTNLTTIGAGNTSKEESWRFEIRVYDGENYSALTPLNPSVMIINSVPTVSNVELTPTTPVTTDGLTVTWDYSDADNDPEGTPLIKWYLENIHQPAYDGETTLPSSATTKGDRWDVDIQVFDGTAYSVEENSFQVVIQNTPPEVNNLALTAAPKTTTDLIASWVAVDNDTGDSLTFNITWYLDGMVNCSWLISANSATLSAGNTTKGDDWAFTVQAYDGSAYSSVISLGYNRTILNTAPIVANLTLTSSPMTMDSLVATFDYSDADVADNTSLVFNITWYRNGQEQSNLANITSIGSGNTTKTQFWWFSVQAYDGESFSLKHESVHVQILNTAPDVANLVITPLTPTTTTHLNASWDDTDADSDSLTYTIRWYIVGVGLQSAYNDLTTVPASATTKGQTWYYNLTAFDGDTYSPETSSSQVVILNSPPKIDSLEVTTNPTTTDDLIASWSTTDNDTGDSLTFNVTWYLDGEMNCSWLTSVPSATLDAGNTTKDQNWNVTVQAYDGEAYSSILSLATNITILNSKPIVENPSFNNTSPEVDDDFHITYTFVDADIDDIENLSRIIVYWYINWDYNASFQNQTTIYAANTTATEVWYYIVRVFDGEAYSDNVTSEQGVYIGGGSANTRPMAIDLMLSPAFPQTHEALIANYTFSDVDKDPEVAYEIRWYRNSGTGFQLQSQYNNLFIVPASATSKGQQWNFTVRVFDGIQWSELNVSSAITIANTNPDVSNAGITSSPKTTDDLVATWTSSDNDSDSLIFIVTWYVNGDENVTFANKTLIEAGNTTKGEEWYFTVQAYDGEEVSNILSLGVNITILNTAPLASNLNITANPYTLNDLVADWIYFDIDNDPRDDASAQIYWFKNGLNQTTLANRKIVGFTNTSKNQVWWFTVRVYDGEDFSIANYESPHVQILNSIPVVENLGISISNPKTTDELVAQWDDNDNDNDILSHTIKWYRNATYQPAWDNEITVPASATSKGETWYYILKAFDGSDYSSEETLSPGVFILNTVPVVEDLALTMNPHTTHDLVANWDATDNDTSDALTFNITWYLDGEVNCSWFTSVSSAALAAGNTTKGQEWYYTVQAYDGEGFSSIISLAENVTILNTAPTANNLTITTNPTTLDDLIADWDYFDIDNDFRDDASARIYWFKNGLNQTILANQKIVGATNTSKNQVWWFSVQVFDGEDYSLANYESVHISIQNAVPYNSSTLPLPMDPTRATGLVLNLSAILAALTDPDPSDDIEVVQISWFKEGVLQSTLNDSLIVPGTRLIKGEVWNYSIVPFDGIDYGVVCVSAEIVILNSKPNIINTYFTEPTVTTISDLMINFQAEDADGDNITVSGVRWYRYEFLSWIHNATYDDYVSLPASATTKGESWKFELAIFDGTDQSVWREAAKEADIINSQPRIDPFSITLTGGSTTSDPLQVTYTWYDDDPEDSNTQTIITWENSGDYLEDTYSNTLPAENTTAGEKWWVTITPYDGEDYGDYVNSKRYGISIIIGNTPPSLVPEDIEIKGELNGTEYQGTSFGTVFNLNLHYIASDLDGDQGVPAYGLSVVDGFALGSEYRWYRNRSGVVTLVSALNDEITVSFYYTQKGDIWWVQVRPRDFYGDFGASQNSSQIIIGNTAPQIAELHWLRLTYYTTNSLVFGYTFFDYDSKDTQQGVFIHWYRNGTYLPGFDNNTAITSQFTRKGEAWYANISVFDGESYSAWYYLLNITIQNSPPTVTNILLTPIFPNTTQPLITTWAFVDADNDSENQIEALIQWYRNGILVDSLMNHSNVPFELTNRGESWYFTVQVTDGYNYSIIVYMSNAITIINSAPTAFDLQINQGALSIYTTDSLALTWNFTDPDVFDIEDTSSALILWYLNSIEQSAFTNVTEIPATYVMKGQQWMVSIKVCDNGGLWSEFLNLSLIAIKNSVPTITIHETAHPEFIIEDEALEINSSFYSYNDEDGDENQPVIVWYCNNELMYQNIWVLLANDTLPGDVWYYTIQPFDGTDFGVECISPEIYVESRPVIHSFVATALPDTEGHYELEINVTDSYNEIKQVEFLLSLNTTTELAPFIITSPKSPGSTLWLLDYTLATYSYLETPILITVTVVTEVSYSITYEIQLIQTFTFTLEDKAPPRVLNAYFEMNDELNPTNLTFYAEVQDFGSGVAEVILSYYFRPSEEINQTGGNGAALLQDDLKWLDVPMTAQIANETGQFLLYMVTVDFVKATSNLDIIYRLSTEDVVGNRNPVAFDIRDYPPRIEAQRFIYQDPGLPEWVLLVAGLAVFVIFVGSIVYVKFIRKPELVGLDKELVLAKISDITEAEVMESLDAHTIGVVVSFFDQRHGPIPIIIIPEILKDNFNKLVDLSDRSFSGTGFSDDFDVEIPSSYDFVLAHGIRTSVMSFGFALERPDSRGGQENLTCNIIIHQDLFPLVQSFQNEIKRKVHAIHVKMDSDPSEKDKIRKEVFELRQFVSFIVLSYANIYGTTELIEEES